MPETSGPDVGLKDARHHIKNAIALMPPWLAANAHQEALAANGRSGDPMRRQSRLLLASGGWTPATSEP
jgi:hypothetical protein